MEHLNPQVPEHDELAIAKPHAHEGLGARLMHRYGDLQPMRELLRGREVIGVRVRIDNVVQA
jgi:hypothetical protein